MLWHHLDARLTNHLAAAETSVVIVAPFIKLSPLKLLLTALGTGVRVEVFTRWLPDEVAAGVSDPAVFQIATAQGAALYLADELHAKLFVVDNRTALVGSANVTSAALGLSHRPNLELLVEVAPAPLSLALFLAELRSRSRLATADEMAAVLAAAESHREAMALAGVTSTTDEGQLHHESQTGADEWLPQFRSPDRLYALYRDTDYLFKARPSDAALRDLVQLSPPPGLDKASFDAHVQHALRYSPLVRALDGYLSEPRRFGAVSGWLSSVLEGADHLARHAAAQVLIRWLTYFDPERYWVEAPNHSEILHRRADQAARHP